MNYYSRKHPSPSARQLVNAAALKAGRPDLVREPLTGAEMKARLREAERALAREERYSLVLACLLGVAAVVLVGLLIVVTLLTRGRV